MSDILFYDKWKNAIKTQDHKLITKFMQELSNEQIKYFDDNLAEWHQDYLEMEQENRNNIEDIWGKGFAIYKLYIDVSVRYSDEYLEYIKQNKRFQDRHAGEMLFTALRFINGRAIHVTNEILVLLKNGYADAACARLRTLYELSVVADFLVKHGDNIAEAYIKYDGKWYDWAKDVIPNKKRILFSDIEKKCNIKEEAIVAWKEEYNVSSQILHASPQGTFARIATGGQMQEILIGPSDRGIRSPAVNAIQHLHHINCLYLGWEKDPFALVFATVLNGLKQNVFEKFDGLEKKYLEKFNKNTSI